MARPVLPISLWLFGRVSGCGGKVESRMTDGYLMDADCEHGVPWFDCPECWPRWYAEEAPVAGDVEDG